MTALLDAIWREEATAVLPQPAPSSYVDFARTIILPDGAEKGKAYNPATHPAQLAILQALDGGTYFAPRPFSQVAAAKPVQDGGSLATLVPLLRRIVQQRQTVMLAFPSLDSAKDIWTTKVVPILAAYGGQEPESGGGSRGGAARVVTLPNGGRFLLRAAGGRGESQQASVTGDALCIDEADDWPDLHRIELMAKRLEEAPDPLLLIVCTVKRGATEGVDASIILAAVAEGTDSRLHFMCPDCGAYQALEWEQVRYETAEQSCVGGSARYVCAHCGVAHKESGRKAMLARWLVVHRGQSVVGTGDDARVDGPIPETPRFSLRWSRLESPRRSLHSLCAADARAKWYLAEKGDHGPMRSFVQDYLTKPYHEGNAEVPQTVDMELAARAASSPYARGEIPVGCGVVTIGADTGKREAWWLGLGMRADLSWYILDWSVKTTDDHRAEPTPADQRAMLDKLRDRVTRLGRANAMGVDVGYNPDLVVKWARANGFKCVRGTRPDDKDSKPSGKKTEDDNKHLPYWAEARRQDDGSLWLFLDVSAIKAEIHKALAREPGTPGAGHLPRGQAASDWLIKHLCSERLIKGVWAKKHKDNHLLDCLVYAWALAMIEADRPAPDYGPPIPKATATRGDDWGDAAAGGDW